MKWKKQKIDISEEKKIITGMIVSDNFLARIQNILDMNLFQIPYSRIIIRWCNEYYNKYGKSPKVDIQSIFNANSKNIHSEDQKELIGEFLSNLSENYVNGESFNSEYAIDQAEKYFRLRKLENTKDELIGALLDLDIDQAEKVIGSFKRVSIPQNSGVDILEDKQQIIQAIDGEGEDIIFRYPGVLGKLISPFRRGNLVAFLAPMKRGKSYWLIDAAIRGLLHGYNVLFVSLEMTYADVIRRIYQNFLGETIKETNLEIPYFDEKDVLYEKKHKLGLSVMRATKKAKSIKKMVGSGRFKLLCFPSNSANINDIRIIMDNLEHYENFVADEIIFDYGDILGPEPDSPRDYRHKLDHTWKEMRGLAHEKNALVVSASQSTKDSLTRDMNQKDVAEDIRKMAHVTTMIALNQTQEDKKKNIMKVKVLAERFEDFHFGKEAIVLQHFGMAKSYIDSRWSTDVNL